MNAFLANTTYPECAPPIIAIIFFAIVTLAFFVLAIVVWCRILGKTGYSRALGLLMFLVLAFSTWPIERELKALKDKTQTE